MLQGKREEASKTDGGSGGAALTTSDAAMHVRDAIAVQPFPAGSGHRHSVCRR